MNFKRNAEAFEPIAQLKDKTGNQINVLNVFKKNNVWVFNDEAVGLYEEPFVSNINPIIATVVEGNEFTAFISHSPIPGENIVLDRVALSGDSNLEETGWYVMRGTGMEGWLCPATLKFFAEYPKEIHVMIQK